MKQFFMIQIDPLGRTFVVGVYNTKEEADKAIEQADGHYGPEFDVELLCGIEQLNEALSQSYDIITE